MVSRAGGGTGIRRSWKRWVAGIACTILLAVAVRAEWPLVAGSVGSFAHLRWRPVVFAVAAETASMVALALMQRRILILAGLRLRTGRAIAVAYASNALSESLPVVGSAAATAYSYQRLVAQGAAPTLAGWAVTLAGVVSSAAFVVVISVGAIVSGSTVGIAAGAAGLALAAGVIGVAAIAIRRPGVRDRVSLAAVWTLTRVQRLVRRPAGDPARLVTGTLTGLGQFHLNRQDVSRIVWSAFRNWGFDLLCLAFSIKAAGVQVPWWGIVLAWAAGAGGASLNLTPGGLGVVEAALTGALVGLGVPGAPALTAVLVYRGITFWLALAIGWPLYWRLRRDRPPAAEARPGLDAKMLDD
jgi:uncharacterized membrane protein YbhN (UPF0104 family)